MPTEKVADTVVSRATFVLLLGGETEWIVGGASTAMVTAAITGPWT